MTLEQAFMIAIGALVSAVTWAVKQLWGSARRCEEARGKMEQRLQALEHDHGEAQGRLMAFDACPQDRCLMKQAGQQPRKSTSRVFPRTREAN